MPLSVLLWEVVLLVVDLVVRLVPGDVLSDGGAYDPVGELARAQGDVGDDDVGIVHVGERVHRVGGAALKRIGVEEAVKVSDWGKVWVGVEGERGVVPCRAVSCRVVSMVNGRGKSCSR